MSRSTRPGFRNLQQELGEVSGQRVVKAVRRSETAIERFRASHERVYVAGVYANTFALMPLTWVLGNFLVSLDSSVN